MSENYHPSEYEDAGGQQPKWHGEERGWLACGCAVPIYIIYLYPKLLSSTLYEEVRQWVIQWRILALANTLGGMNLECKRRDQLEISACDELRSA